MYSTGDRRLPRELYSDAAPTEHSWAHIAQDRAKGAVTFAEGRVAFLSPMEYLIVIELHRLDLLMTGNITNISHKTHVKRLSESTNYSKCYNFCFHKFFIIGDIVIAYIVVHTTCLALPPANLDPAACAREPFARSWWRARCGEVSVDIAALMLLCTVVREAASLPHPGFTSETRTYVKE